MKRLGYLNQRAEDPTLWNDAQEAQNLMRERQQLEDSINGINHLKQAAERWSVELIAMGEEEGDKSIVEDAEKPSVTSRMRSTAARSTCSSPAKPMRTTPIWKSMRAQAARKSQDWASMLLRMYTRWAERNRAQGGGHGSA